MSLVILFTCYQLIQILLLPFVVVYLLLRKVKKKQAFGNVAHRCGFVQKSPQPCIWLHAVSVGEVLSLQQIIRDIKKQSPQKSVYVTVGTSTGYTMACKYLKADCVSYIPFDFLACLLIAFKRIKPQALVIVESDFWPNLIMLSKFKRVPIYALNARMNKKKEAFRKKVAFVLKPLLSCFEHFYVQSQYDQQEFAKLGVSQGKITVLGNLKAYNVVGKQAQENLITTSNHYQNYKILLLGSVHPGELDGYLTMYQKLKKTIPDLKLLIAPRHFHWQQELMDKIKQVSNKSDLWLNQVFLKQLDKKQLDNKLRLSYEQNDIIVVCTLGLLFHLYQYATIFYLGGTFVPIGGHNLLEPAVWGNAIVMGPHDENCTDIANSLEHKNAVVRVQSFEQAYKESLHLLTHNMRQHEIGLNARIWLEMESAQVKQKLDLLLKSLC